MSGTAATSPGSTRAATPISTPPQDPRPRGLGRLRLAGRPFGDRRRDDPAALAGAESRAGQCLSRDPGPHSMHPVNVAIRSMVSGGRADTHATVEAIQARISSVGFDGSLRRVPHALRGLSYLGKRLDRRERSDLIHVARRVLIDEQWSERTTLRSYLDDLRRAVRHPDARFAVYHRRGGALAAILAPTNLIVSSESRGARALAGLIVVYSADRGCLITGYQYSSEATLYIPGDAQWLN